MTQENKKNILLIEDDSAIIDIYTTMIKKADFKVEVITLGQEAIKKIKSLKSIKEVPDIILLDLILPDINGVEVLKEIRKNNITKDGVVFILTNQQNVEFRGLDNIKPDKFIIKANITPSQLLETIKEYLGQKGLKF
ncbi:MAG: hypothetical protein A3A98_01290 [Candidatus Staskawiczbacteria bacterium RIFCSPLOWO2_01_FULL_40_39]|uniref:Response regulatory domain-containing protein n=1 Tax=Candidatus Staskawiczbacteria bacterium RIFCSPHIGHO2_01_FULL_39_25 TaxID=1802202 RepID=A0A1G2HMZ7_9BACT|nr:MAG: hypothetical protein A2730_01290 [Candidatus Staskawiczbacteria bacterium RIFCSPHIGHO2_01_FULL_39_25]OGZ73362.1 MAG: hypothetical protein A3A98_01290 [Candidatus Staskawiczbacteria bacterium RIFCSPLOWO2_01_FULL_40_39]OGZ75974.1 MAG: hypothetical protein A3I87_02430 [Candidatus Staskawiczbacteria bacterium RIFCSPLOWO2_02_FULL_39_8]